MKRFIDIEDNEESIFKPQLTSLIDVMTILLVFLIKSFSVSGNLVTPSNDLVLPTSVSKTNAKDVPSIEISSKNILNDGKLVVGIDEVMQRDSMMIIELKKVLVDLKLQDTTQRKIMIQCDKNIKFDLIKRVMFTSSRSGFSDYSVLVVGEE